MILQFLVRQPMLTLFTLFIGTCGAALSLRIVPARLGPDWPGSGR